MSDRCPGHFLPIQEHCISVSWLVTPERHLCIDCRVRYLSTKMLFRQCECYVSKFLIDGLATIDTYLFLRWLEQPTVPKENDLERSVEQRCTPPMSNSWLSSINSYNELEANAGAFSHDSLDCLSWAHGGNNGRPESPLEFDHEEVLQIDPEGTNVCYWHFIYRCCVA